MGKRGVLAAAFLAMAVGVVGAEDDGDLQPPPAATNTCDVTIGGVGNPPAAGKCTGEGSFGGFTTAWVTYAEVTLYSVTKDASGNRVETPLAPPQTFNKVWTTGVKDGKVPYTTAIAIAKNTVVCAKFNISSSVNGTPINAKVSDKSKDYTIP